MRCGLTRNPPQKSGKGISPLLNLFFIAVNCCNNNAREEMGRLCCEAQAANWLSRGRLRKYLSDSALEIGSAIPHTFTWRSRQCQGKCKLTFGFCFNSCALRLRKLV